jgi:hypothetical protein
VVGNMRTDPSQFTVPDGLWDRPEMIAACREQDFGVILALVKKYSGASHSGLSMRTGIPTSEISQIPSGGQRVEKFGRIVAIADGLDIPDRARLLLGVAPRGGTAAVTQVAAVSPWADARPLHGPPWPQVVTPGQATDSPRAILDVDARTWEGQVKMAARRALRFSTSSAGTNVTAETIAQLHDEVCRLAHAYPRQPLPALLGDLADLQDTVFGLLEGRQRPNQTRDLYLLAGALCGMLAKASHDLADPYAAMTQARTAYVCADNADHDGLRAWVRGMQSLIAYWAGWPQEAARYAEHGADLATQVSGSTSVWLPALQARAAAALGDSDSTAAAVDRAAAARDRATPDELDQIGGLLSFPRPRQLYYAADATAWLAGQEDRAEREATEAVHAYQTAEADEQSFSDEAGSRADLALARARRGALDGAREALDPVLDLPRAQRVAGIVLSMHRIHQALRTPQYTGSHAAREAQEEIEAFCRTPVAALPR